MAFEGEGIIVYIILPICNIISIIQDIFCLQLNIYKKILKNKIYKPLMSKYIFII